jgi:flagellar basal body-associated protein FliL
MSDSSHDKKDKAAGGGKSPMMMAIAAAVVLAGAGGGFYMFKMKGAEAAAPAEPEPAHHGAVAFSALTVNLASQPSRHFLRATVQVIVGSPEVAKEMEESAAEMAKARATMLEVLSTQTAEVLVTAEGKAEVRKTLTERLAHDLHGIEVVDVLFSDFVVQF